VNLNFRFHIYSELWFWVNGVDSKVIVGNIFPHKKGCTWNLQAFVFWCLERLVTTKCFWNYIFFKFQNV
jgi:hypothetical protein